MFVMQDGGSQNPYHLAVGSVMALIYASLIVASPLSLPAKKPELMSRQALVYTAIILTLIVGGFISLSTILERVFGRVFPGENVGGSGLVMLIAIIILGTAGYAAERALPVNLLPAIRKRDYRWIVYVLVAPLFLMLLKQLWAGIAGNIAGAIGSLFGEIMPPRESLGTFDTSQPLHIFLQFFIGAGLFEEIPFRLGIMTIIWKRTGKWQLGLLVSSLLFGIYHVTFSGSRAYFLQAPVISVIHSALVGGFTGIVYRYRGFMAAVMIHALGNWFSVMLFM